jgi:hypothetical protein
MKDMSCGAVPVRADKKTREYPRMSCDTFLEPAHCNLYQYDSMFCGALPEQPNQKEVFDMKFLPTLRMEPSPKFKPSSCNVFSCAALEPTNTKITRCGTWCALFSLARTD